MKLAIILTVLFASSCQITPNKKISKIFCVEKPKVFSIKQKIDTSLINKYLKYQNVENKPIVFLDSLFHLHLKRYLLLPDGELTSPIGIVEDTLTHIRIAFLGIVSKQQNIYGCLQMSFIKDSLKYILIAKRPMSSPLLLGYDLPLYKYDWELSYDFKIQGNTSPQAKQYFLRQKIFKTRWRISKEGEFYPVEEQYEIKTKDSTYILKECSNGRSVFATTYQTASVRLPVAKQQNAELKLY